MWHNVYYLVPAVLLAAAAVAAIRAKVLVKRVPFAKGLPGRGLPLLDTAFLSGGPGRVFDTALVRMHQAGRVVVNRAGLVTVTTGTPYDAVDLAIIEAVGPSKHRDLTPLRREVMRSPAVQEIGDRLADRGLMRNPVRLRRARLARRRLWFALLGVVVFTVAAYLLDSGDAGSDRPAPWIPPVLLVVGLVALILTWPVKGRITLAGCRQLILMNSGKPWKPSAGLAPRSTGGALLGAIALGGLAAAGLGDEELQEAMLAAAAADAAARSTAATGGSSSSSSSSSSCSSSSSGSSCGGSAAWCGSSDSGSSGSGCGGGSCGSSSSGCGSSSSSCGSGSSSCGSSSSSSCGSSCGGSSCGS
ncbi:TIGR04222 domain-containing membrane protein [Kitasatospora sp. NPDC088351]|uniref:TIGR04222 domain-containing membrane protein n=1 Tax=unclassified Kitasatospora TaxID=2633591 RepID=UPI0034350869